MSTAGRTVAMDLAEIRSHLRRVPEWRLVDGAIERQFKFGDYDRTMAFVNAVADIARDQDHHPTLVVNYGDCTVRLNTHSVAGLSIKDFVCAAKVDALSP